MWAGEHGAGSVSYHCRGLLAWQVFWVDPSQLLQHPVLPAQILHLAVTQILQRHKDGSFGDMTLLQR